MFKELADKFRPYCSEKDSIVIGFSETATALGLYVASYLKTEYVTTTRESLRAEYLSFKEEHSHTPEHKLINLDFTRYTHVIIIDDEISSGNTIRNLISVLNKKNPNMKIPVGTILLNDYARFPDSVDVHYLVKRSELVANDKMQHITFRAYSVHNPRLGINAEQYDNELTEICLQLPFIENKSILVIGTEECMYPAIIIGSWLESMNNSVCCHSTTRSPIKTPNAELHQCSIITSAYDVDRLTYIYNVHKYDEVYIVSDCGNITKGIRELVDLLSSCGNNNITVLILNNENIV